jgi:hypothetical protein
MHICVDQFQIRVFPALSTEPPHSNDTPQQRHPTAVSAAFTQTLASKLHSPVKGTRSSLENIEVDDSRARTGKINTR